MTIYLPGFLMMTMMIKEMDDHLPGFLMMTVMIKERDDHLSTWLSDDDNDDKGEG